MKSTQPSISETRALVKRAHAGQTDQAGEPYYLHPFRVEQRVQLLPGVGEDDCVVALLHDVMEDTKLTAPDLAEIGYQAHIVEAVQLLTNREQHYATFIEKIIASRNELVMRVKLADILDNLDPDRLAALPHDRAVRFRSKYEGPAARLRAELQIPNRFDGIEGARSGEFFYLDEGGNKRDADLHEAILNNPRAEESIQRRARERAKQRGITGAEALDRLYGSERENTKSGADEE